MKSIRLHLLKLPLRVPYKLSLGVVREFDTLLVEVGDEDGRTGYGEATYLPGYSEETVEEAWPLANDIAPRLLAGDTVDVHAQAPFTQTAFVSAVEMLEGNPLLAVDTQVRVPLLAIVNASAEKEIEDEIEGHLAAGYGTLKLKVGFDIDADLTRVRFIQNLVGGRADIRIDANQGYDQTDGCRFAAEVDPAGVELLEQPCAAGDWKAAEAVAAVTAVPLMLDESIYGLEDVKRAADLKAASLIKFKLMKAGGLDRLAEALELIRSLGMEPVLGNGVAGEIGCWMEACVARTLIDNAGEMNGFIKPRDSILRRPLRIEKGAMILEPGWRPEIDIEALAAVTVATASFPAS
jgi:L-Ala-D/L-Glu epimerase